MREQSRLRGVEADVGIDTPAPCGAALFSLSYDATKLAEAFVQDADI
jgi:hypothetical protein